MSKNIPTTNNEAAREVLSLDPAQIAYEAIEKGRTACRERADESRAIEKVLWIVNDQTGVAMCMRCDCVSTFDPRRPLDRIFTDKYKPVEPIGLPVYSPDTVANVRAPIEMQLEEERRLVLRGARTAEGGFVTKDQVDAKEARMVSQALNAFRIAAMGVFTSGFGKIIDNVTGHSTAVGRPYKGQFTIDMWPAAGVRVVAEISREQAEAGFVPTNLWTAPHDPKIRLTRSTG